MLRCGKSCGKIKKLLTLYTGKKDDLIYTKSYTQDINIVIPRIKWREKRVKDNDYNHKRVKSGGKWRILKNHFT